MKFPHWRAAALACLPVAVLISAGCGGGGGGIGGGSSTPQGRVRVFNALTGTTNNIDANLNNRQVVANNIAFNTIGPINGPATINSGNGVPVAAVQTGTSSVIASNNVPITQGADQLLLVTGAAGTAGATAPQITDVGVTDLSSPPVSDEARVYFINAAVGSSTTASFNVSINGVPFTTGNDVAALAYNSMSAAELPAIPEGLPNNSFMVTAKVGTQTVGPTGFNLKGGSTYAVILTGQTTAAGGNPPLALQLVLLNGS